MLLIFLLCDVLMVQFEEMDVSHLAALMRRFTKDRLQSFWKYCLMEINDHHLGFVIFINLSLHVSDSTADILLLLDYRSFAPADVSACTDTQNNEPKSGNSGKIIWLIL